MIPGAREPEEGGLEEGPDEERIEYQPDSWEPEGEPAPTPEPDLMGEEGGGGGYGRPREISDEDES